MAHTFIQIANAVLHVAHTPTAQQVTVTFDAAQIVTWLIIGTIAGFLAGALIRGRRYGFVSSIIVGLQRSRLACDVTLLPLADGGDGTLAIMIRALGGEQIPIQVTGPDGIPIIAQLGLLADGQTAIVETAQASGVERIASAVRDPLHATSYGTGELISAALSRGYPRIIVGLGGSATNDGGAGAMQILVQRLWSGK